MKVKEKLKHLLMYYETSRQIGHTTLMKEGTKHYNEDFFVLSRHTSDHKFMELTPNQVVSWENIDKLCGHRKPMVIDNYALSTLLSDTINEIERLEEENHELLELKLNMIKLLNES